MIRFDRSVCGDLEQANQLEWLETNGLGGFSSSTITGLNTRRYHGLLTAATKPPVGRYVLLSKLEETVIVGGQHFDLACNRYAGALYPLGFQYLQEFRLDPFPAFVYRVDDVVIEKRVFLVHGENSVVVQYDLQTPADHGGAVLELRPLVAFRDYHSTTHRNAALNGAFHSEPGLVSIAPYEGLPALYFAHNAQAVEDAGHWYYQFDYEKERERGLDCLEDLFNPFLLRYSLEDGAKAVVIASTIPHRASEASDLREAEIARRRNIRSSAPASDDLIEDLTAAADQFIVQRGNLHSVIAGYHWFSDWGRDTMVALPGLTLATGRPHIARDILQAFVDSADRGMLPNRFPDAGERPEFNTVDATLWLFEAVRSYVEYTGDLDFVREKLYGKLKEILEWHMRGTRYGIRADRDGLLACGEPGVQLTWMDSKIGDWVVTPRYGKPVEIQALWYNALQTMHALAAQLRDPGPQSFFADAAAHAASSFSEQFWNQARNCLYDVVNESGRDPAMRPNQILAVSLHHSMLSRDKQRLVVEAVQRELLTPIGLRSLAPGDPNYRGHYTGSPSQRDSMYHQGTVWSWLLGPYISAYVKVHEHSVESRRNAKELLQSIRDHLLTAGLGQISEIADADPPYTPRGCIAQAWSVGEILRAAIEDVYDIAPTRRSETATIAG